MEKATTPGSFPLTATYSVAQELRYDMGEWFEGGLIRVLLPAACTFSAGATSDGHDDPPKKLSER